MIFMIISSVGILGGISDAQISNVLVDGAKLVGTANGVKINTYPVRKTLVFQSTFVNQYPMYVTNDQVLYF